MSEPVPTKLSERDIDTLSDRMAERVCDWIETRYDMLTEKQWEAVHDQLVPEFIAALAVLRFAGDAA